MNLWNFTLSFKDMVLDLSFMSVFLVAGTVFRRYGLFFQKYLVPNNLIAGFIGLILGTQVLGWIPISGERMGLYVYHLLALTFVAIGLRGEKTSWGKGPLSFSISMLTSYIIQGIIGVLVCFIFIYTIRPDLFAGLGLLLPMGFGMGPGQAFTIGTGWEKFGFEGGGMAGLTIAAVGYLIAYFAGMVIVNKGIRRGETALIEGLDSITSDMRTGVIKNGEKPVAGFLTLSMEAIEPLAFQVGVIGVVYLISFWVAKGVEFLLLSIGGAGFVSTVWAFHFVIALIVALVMRKVLDKTKKSYLIDKGLMTRTAGLFVDYLIVGSICGISLKVVWMYWAPILIMAILGGIATYYMLKYVCYRAFDDYHFERFAAVFAEMTGTLNSGLVMIRVMDPEFKTPVAEDLVYSSGIALFLGMPLLV
ncbi:MAG: sodium:glutamate symporter, partial [Candidatus Marinimicrobia bacterium]|nr:sodium:glutamate symporter [Candidatus Neomarinimicrobiota bacterium]